MRVLVVSGTRKLYSSRASDFVFDTICGVYTNTVQDPYSFNNYRLIIHGACGWDADDKNWNAENLLGVDRQAYYYASDYGVQLPMPARWAKLGDYAGRERNHRMLVVAQSLLNCGHEVKLIAFPDEKSRGTRNFISQAQKIQQLAERLRVVELE